MSHRCSNKFTKSHSDFYVACCTTQCLAQIFIFFAFLTSCDKYECDMVQSGRNFYKTTDRVAAGFTCTSLSGYTFCALRSYERHSTNTNLPVSATEVAYFELCVSLVIRPTTTSSSSSLSRMHRRWRPAQCSDSPNDMCTRVPTRPTRHLALAASERPRARAHGKEEQKEEKNIGKGRKRNERERKRREASSPSRREKGAREERATRASTCA